MVWYKCSTIYCKRCEYQISHRKDGTVYFASIPRQYLQRLWQSNPSHWLTHDKVCQFAIDCTLRYFLQEDIAIRKGLLMENICLTSHKPLIPIVRDSVLEAQVKGFSKEEGGGFVWASSNFCLCEVLQTTIKAIKYVVWCQHTFQMCNATYVVRWKAKSCFFWVIRLLQAESKNLRSLVEWTKTIKCPSAPWHPSQHGCEPSNCL